MIDFKKKMEELEKQQNRENFTDEIFTDQTKNKKKKKITFYLIVFLVLGLVFSGKVIMSSQSTTDWLSGKNIFNTIKHLVPSSDKQLKGENDDQINILLLGIGGEGHDGAYLTDTIILASLKPSTREIALVSIPRDLTVPIEGNSWRKINSINAIAEAANKDGGAETIKTLSQVFQIPIQYFIRVDFKGFTNIIDEIGGIEINVENTLNDYSYPILGQEDNPDYYARYEHLNIEKGPTKMNGDLALKYVRSRHAYGIEGSDFARARRQQLVIEAVKNKLLSTQTLLNPVTVSRLINELNKHLATNLETWEVIRLWDLFKDVDHNQIKNVVLNDAPGNYLKSATGSDGAYILIPVSGNFGDIRNLFNNLFETNNEKIEKENESEPEIIKINEKANIAVKNGTFVTGLAGRIAADLESLGLTVIDISNAPERNQTKSLIFDFTYGDKNEVLNALKNKTQAKQSFSFPSWINTYQSEHPEIDFLILLGSDTQN
ncbi:MAG: polyisoprenyl-teichoic acid--peptidoglycan teichoic acid transferase [Patescibacteria group bacterium]|nr:polyisoprenyl-teichoic acid--peptidoglycan teichoic acid transferase [Patescibacteria group bacterium]